MHQQIKNKLGESFQILNDELLFKDHIDWLIEFLRSIAKIENDCAPYATTISELYHKIPDMDQSDINDAIADIVGLLYGRHNLIHKYTTDMTSENVLIILSTLHGEVRDSILDEYNAYITQNENGKLQIIWDDII